MAGVNHTLAVVGFSCAAGSGFTRFGASFEPPADWSLASCLRLGADAHVIVFRRRATRDQLGAMSIGLLIGLTFASLMGAMLAIVYALARG